MVWPAAGCGRGTRGPRRQRATLWERTRYVTRRCQRVSPPPPPLRILTYAPRRTPSKPPRLASPNLTPPHPTSPHLTLARSNPSLSPCASSYEMSMAVNHLGHFLLCNLLIDDMAKSKDARCVIVGSITGEPNGSNGSNAADRSPPAVHPPTVRHPRFSHPTTPPNRQLEHGRRWPGLPAGGRWPVRGLGAGQWRG